MKADDRWPEIKEHLDAVLDLEPDERAAYLDTHCANDEILRTEILAYLSAEDQASAFPTEPLVDLFEARPPEGREGQQLGVWRLEHQVGQGGMGVVYLACRDDDVYEQRAAVKVLKRGFDTGEVVRRFARERRILARLDHPNVARVLDGGATEDGLPYFVMEHVEGRPVDEYCRDLPLEEVLTLFRTICETVQMAHQNLVVHCDLKPANILVTADGEPKLLDFGIAKLLRSDDDGGETRTLAAWRLGTPGYASPEQEHGEPITTASDVYSLGVLLYRLLTGHEPDADIRKPSSLSERWGRRLRGDLDNIVLEALHAEPERRYASAAALAEDVRRHLEHWPVLACPDSVPYRLRRFVRRHPAGVSTGVAVALLATIFVSVLTGQYRDVKAQRDLGNTVLDLLGNFGPTNTRSDAEQLRLLEAQLQTALSSDPADRSRLLDRVGRIYYRLGFHDRAQAWLEESLELRRRTAGVDPETVAASLANLGHVLIDQGDTERGTELLAEALAIRRRHDPGDEEAMIRTETARAKGLEAQGRYPEAEVIYRDLVRRRRAHFGERTVDYARGLNNLAVVVWRQGRLAEAQKLFERSLELWRALRGSQSADYVTTESNYALVLDGRGQYHAAIHHLRHVLEVRRDRFDASSLLLARTYGALAFSLLGSGESDELAEAESLLRRAIEIYRQQASDHPNVLVFQRNLAATLIARGDSQNAEVLAREVLELSLERLEPGHWRIADARSVLGHALLTQGRETEAERLLVESLPIIREATGEHSRYTRDALERCSTLCSP